MNINGAADVAKEKDSNSKPPFRRPSRRRTYVIAAIIVLCLMICIVLAVLLSPKSKDDCPKGIHCDWHAMPHSEFLKDERCDILCTTRPCIRSADYVLSRIDSSKDPCEDFYEFACGTYEQQSVLLPENSEGVFTYQEMENEMLLNLKEIIDSIAKNPAIKKGFSLKLVKRVYEDCLNIDHHTDVLTKDIWKEFLFADGGILPWPLLNENARNDQKHFVKMMSSSLFYDVNPFFSMFRIWERTVNNRTQWIFRFTETENLDMLRSIHKESNVDDEGSAYSRYRLALLEILTEVGVDVEEIENITTRILDLEREFLAAATKAMESNEKVYEQNHYLRDEYHTHNCQDLDHNMTHIKWCKIVGQLRADYGIPANGNVAIELPSVRGYFVEVNTVLGHFFDRVIMDYIALKFVMGHMKYMPSPLREIYYREKVLFPKVERYWTLSARWQQCVEIVTDVLWLPLEKEYLKQKLCEEKLTKVRHMVKRVKETYMSAVDKMSWMKTAIPGRDLKKMIQELELIIGRVNTLPFQEDATLDNYYETGFSRSPEVTKSLLSDVLLLKKLNMKALLLPNGELDILASGQSFTLFKYYIVLGKIEIPYSMLSFSMTLSGRPMFAEYATLGAFIFKYISNLMLLQIRDDNSSMKVFKMAENCLREQSHLYKTGKMKFKVDMTEETRLALEFVNALGTLGSFQAYVDYLKENGEDKGLPGLPFTNKQLFFISNAQANCEKFTEKGYADFPRQLVSPARFRVNVPLANSKAFSEAFRCPSGSPMNPKRKCCMMGDGMLSHDCKWPLSY